jgi:hypothetical protein
MGHTISEFYLWTLILFTFNNCVLLQKPSSGENPTFFNIGGVLSNSDSEKNFSETIAVSKHCNFCDVAGRQNVQQFTVIISLFSPSFSRFVSCHFTQKFPEKGSTSDSLFAKAQ